MPELPEVETLRRELTLAVKSKTIKSAEVKVAKLVLPLSINEFQTKIKNKKVLEILRRAKILIVRLSSDLFLLIHLKMTGQLIFQPKKGRVIMGGHPQKNGTTDLPNKFTHIIFDFSDGSKLYFNDARKFGWMRLVDKNYVDKVVDDYGVEPLSKEFTLKKFKEILNKYPNRKIKQVLMDQSLIAGVGNIYNDESCFCAKIKPMRIVKTLGDKEVKDLYVCLVKILKLSITKKGTSANTYIQLDGKPGGFVPYLKVYGRYKEKCKRCSGRVVRIKMNGRGTHFCPDCQK